MEKNNNLSGMGSAAVFVYDSVKKSMLLYKSSIVKMLKKVVMFRTKGRTYYLLRLTTKYLTVL